MVYIDKYDKHRAIPAPTSLLATANPRDNKWQNEDRIDSDEFKIPLQQVSRFDIVKVFRDQHDKDADRKYAEEKSIREEREFRRSDDFIVSFLEKYIEYARIYYSPLSIDNDAKALFK
jgi:DNA replicative helicase MCM subunit Mcm2 (Cdc46/Mcm family)